MLHRNGPVGYKICGVMQQCVYGTKICEGERAAYCEVYGRSALSCAKMAEAIEMPFALWTRVSPSKHVFHGGADWRNLANTFEPSMCSGDAAFLSNCFDHLLILLSLPFK